MKLNIPFDGSKIQITRVRATDWGRKCCPLSL